jgi:hypothetical protein
MGGAKIPYPDIFLIIDAIVTKLGTNVKGSKRTKMADFFKSVM